MGVLDDQPPVNARKPRASHPKGYEPGFEWNGRTGWIVSDPSTGANPPQFEALLAELGDAMGFDPGDYEIVGPIQVRRWQQRPGEDYLYYHRATIALKASLDVIDHDVEVLAKRVEKRKNRTTVPEVTGTAGLVVALADWQVGKADGDGVEGTMARLDDIARQLKDRVRQLKRIGVEVSTIYPCFMGDLFESCSGHYAQQEFRTQLNIRDQRKVIRWAADRIIDTASTLAPQVAVKVVGGNHGEERQGGKSNTDFADNRDVAVIEDIAYAYSRSERYGHVSFAIPNDDLTLTFDHEGVIVGLAHSHQAGFGSGDPRAKIDRWWRGMMAGQQPIGDADILVTAHWHHSWMLRSGSRTHFGCPALDGGSDWFRNYSGMDSPPGTLSFVVDGSGWSHMDIFPGVRHDPRS